MLESARDRETRQLSEAVPLFEIYKNKGLTYQSAEDGFVFSNAEIEALIRRRDRLKVAPA